MTTSSSSLLDQISQEAAQLTPENQQIAFTFVHQLLGAQNRPSRLDALSSPDSLLKFSGAIPREDLDEMERIIEESCENIDDAEQ